MDVYRAIQLPGFVLNKVDLISGKSAVPCGEILSYEMPDELLENAQEACQRFKDIAEWSFTKTVEQRSKDYDLKEIVLNLYLTDTILSVEKTLVGPSIWDILAELLNSPKTSLFAGRLVRVDWIW